MEEVISIGKGIQKGFWIIWLSVRDTTIDEQNPSKYEKHDLCCTLIRKGWYVFGLYIIFFWDFYVGTCWKGIY